uniref:Transmembrane protein 79-like n=1 Tax=Crassostrea virginica TaxID=6565 RepID=A0A8B8D1N9_CRAVI|nr:transmembrane protein 79-like [Crassostrea virginica]
MSDKQKDKRSFQQKKAFVIKQIATSIAISVTVFVVSYLYLPINTSHLKELPDRLALTISCLFVSSFSVLMGIYLVGQIRGNSNAIDPVNGGAENLVDVRNRILRNTTEQFILHVMAMLTLTLFLEGTSMKVIPILSGIFLTARIAFQIGYISSPIKRAYGFASTFLPTVAVYAYCTFRMVQRLI